jgi:PIN domain nuclease of toxin-antitoxin system
VRLLLDTHVLLWALSTPRRIGARSLKLIEQSEVHVSAASIFEISVKASIGKLKADPDEVLGSVARSGFVMLDLTGEHAARVFSLRTAHPDPFDRLLVAQAEVENLTLLTADEALLPFGPVVRMV